MNNGVFFVTGTAGTGKTTVLRKLISCGEETIGIDEEPGLVGWKNKETGHAIPRGAELTKEFLDKHAWECDVTKLQSLISQKSRPLVICGSCDNFLDIMELCQKTFVLVCEPEVFLDRIAKRRDNEYGKTEVAKNAVLGYYEKYRDTCVSHGGISVDAAQPIDVVVEIIKKAIK